MSEKIYTHDEAMLIIELFEELLDAHDISIPSPEDDERDDTCARLYGSVYSDLLDLVEDHLIGLLDRHGWNTKVIAAEFSGCV